MLTAKQRSFNQEYWAFWAKSTLEGLKWWPEQKYQKENDESVSLQSLAFWCTSNGFMLFAAGYEKEAELFFRDAIAAAENALRTQRYDHIYPGSLRSEQNALDFLTDPSIPPDVVCQPTAEEVYKETLSGQAYTLLWLGYARWFLSGTFPLNTFAESVRCERKYYEANSSNLSVSYLETLMLHYVAVEEYQEALDLFQREAPAKPYPVWSAEDSFDVPKTGEGDRKIPALVTLAEFALGRNDVEPLARNNINHWYQICSLWGAREGLTWPERVHWAYLRAKHFTGVKDARRLVDELRGY